MNYEKYRKNYYMPPETCLDWAKKDAIDRAPIWCSVDLRDGNQALVIPMSLEQKIEFFDLLVRIGFKEIEVGFPAASETEYLFLRTLIEKDLIPKDVTVQVLTQAREHIIKKTFEALRGAPRSVVHVYNSVSVAQREQVFRKSKAEIKEIAVRGAELLGELAEKTEGNFLFEYSPESFTGTEPEYALEVCNAVVNVWKPTPERKVILNLPATVETALPHVFASQVEYLHKNLDRRDSIVLSLHPHNDRGTGVADAELGLLAGADRIEGTLFGNGERTGNVDIVTLALNLFSHGVDPKLDFSDMPKISEAYERLTDMRVPPRAPYGGSLVFAAFSGSHQDAIAKGMKYREERGDGVWNVPYLPIDPHDVGREYDGDVIRINSQSGKGGVGYILEQKYGLNLPKAMREAVSYAVKAVSDRKHKELKAEEIKAIFDERFLDRTSPYEVEEAAFAEDGGGVLAEIVAKKGGEKFALTARGNGQLDAVSNALKARFGLNYDIVTYEEHALSVGSDSAAIAYVGIRSGEEIDWGAGVDGDIIRASYKALVSAVNALACREKEGNTSEKKRGDSPKRAEKR